jgi:hypothetical protein
LFNDGEGGESDDEAAAAAGVDDRMGKADDDNEFG